MGFEFFFSFFSLPLNFHYWVFIGLYQFSYSFFLAWTSLCGDEEERIRVYNFKNVLLHFSEKLAKKPKYDETKNGIFKTIATVKLINRDKVQDIRIFLLFSIQHKQNIFLFTQYHIFWKNELKTDFNVNCGIEKIKSWKTKTKVKG